MRQQDGLEGLLPKAGTEVAHEYVWLEQLESALPRLAALDTAVPFRHPQARSPQTLRTIPRTMTRTNEDSVVVVPSNSSA